MKRLAIIVALSASLCTAAQTYSDGVWILNEDWFGHNNSTLNFWNFSEDYIDYNVVGKVNPGHALGCTAQFGQLYGERLLITAKQAHDDGAPAEEQGGRISLLSAADASLISSLDEIAPGADGRSCLWVQSWGGVEKCYIGTSNGIHIFNPLTGAIEGVIEGTENPLASDATDNRDGLGGLYQNQIGTMLRTQNWVFAIQQDRGILVIDPATDRIVHVVDGCFSTMTQARNGNIYAGVNIGEEQHYPYGPDGSGWNGNQLLVIDQYTLATRTIDLNAGGVAQTWGAWNAGSLSASATDDYLFFAYADPAEESGMNTHWLYRFNTVTEEVDAAIDIAEDYYSGPFFYGASAQCSPADGRVYCLLRADALIATQKWAYYVLSPELEIEQVKLPYDNYWYPAMFIFPDNHAPRVISEPSGTITDDSPEYRVAIDDLVTDDDNLDAAIIAVVSDIDAPDVVEAQIEEGYLVARPLASGNVVVTLSFFSNGKSVEMSIPIEVNISDGVERVPLSPVTVIATSQGILFKGITGTERVEVYSSAGSHLLSIDAYDGCLIRSLPRGAIYLVRVADKTFKIAL